ncbi:MAG: hypothetical protein JNM62_08250 [Flavobacteriales bacterium]|nr:hypothetical protein [Flavobacteriales bacterium]
MPETPLFHKLLTAAVLAMSLCMGDVLAQCPNDNSVTGSAIALACPGSASGGCVQGGQYALVNVTSGNIYTFSTCDASWNTMITLYNGGAASSLTFNDDACTTTRSAVQWTATYTGQVRVLVDRSNCNTNGTCAPLWITCSLNDDRCSATPLTVGTSCTNSTGTNAGATATSGVGAPSCSNYAGGDVWFRFTAPASGQVTITSSTVSGSSLTDGGMAVYSASACGSTFTEVGCNDDTPTSYMPALSLSGLTSGVTYYIRFWEYGNNSFGQFNICVTTPAAPANDNPCTATTLTVGSSCTNTTSTTSGSTNTTGVSTPTCGNYLGNDVWFRVVAPASGTVVISTSTVTGSSLTNAAMALYSASACGATMTELSCNDNSVSSNMPELVATGLTSGVSYYVRVWANGNTAFGQFNLCAVEPPANDEPCGAIALTVGSSCSMASRTNMGATYSSAAALAGCGSLNAASHDVWYRFTAPSSGIAIIESTSGTLTDGSMALYSSTSCTASNLTLIQCSADEGMGTMPFLRFADLVPGATYYLRYWGSGSAEGTFNLCVWSPTMPSGSCVYFLELWDSGENGWGTSEVQTQVNSSPVVSTTVAASDFYECRLIGVNNGDMFMVSYVNSGANQAQNRYQIRQVPGGDGVLTQGPSPASGISLLETIDCVPPDAPKEDCEGSMSICNGQTFNDNPSGTGFDVDLRYGTFGCLASAERQGTWYKFSPSASGTIGLTISPSTSTNDYDFAVWGPESGIFCPPYKRPKRCSYSGTTGDTGMRTSSADTTEDDTGDKWVAALNAVAGERYLLYISNYSQSGLAFSLSWQLTNGAALDCSLLPVDFIELQAELSGDVVDVTWSTASETNASHYVVERSADAENYVPIGTVQAVGNSTQLSSYSYLDEHPAEGLNYYRVRQMDMDGSAQESPADYAIYRKGTSDMVVFPNPAGNILWASFEMPEEDAVIWRVLDAQGRLVEQDLYQGTKGNMLIDIPLERLAVGSYTLLINDSRGLMNRSAHFLKH